MKQIAVQYINTLVSPLIVLSPMMMIIISISDPFSSLTPLPVTVSVITITFLVSIPFPSSISISTSVSVSVPLLVPVFVSVRVPVPFLIPPFFPFFLPAFRRLPLIFTRTTLQRTLFARKPSQDMNISQGKSRDMQRTRTKLTVHISSKLIQIIADTNFFLNS